MPVRALRQYSYLPPICLTLALKTMNAREGIKTLRLDIAA